MKTIILLFLILLGVACAELESEKEDQTTESANLQKETQGEEKPSENTKKLKNVLLTNYPAGLDEAIDKKLDELKKGEDYKKVRQRVFHPASNNKIEEIGGVKTKVDPYIDTTEYMVLLNLETQKGEEKWALIFNDNLRCIIEMLRDHPDPSKLDKNGFYVSGHE